MLRPSSRALAAAVTLTLVFLHATGSSQQLDEAAAAAAALTAAAAAGGGCPEECVCMWKSGKETTECINRDRDAIPEGIEPSTQVLDLRGNNIRVLANQVNYIYSEVPNKRTGSFI